MDRSRRSIETWNSEERLLMRPTAGRRFIVRDTRQFIGISTRLSETSIRELRNRAEPYRLGCRVQPFPGLTSVGGGPRAARREKTPAPWGVRMVSTGGSENRPSPRTLERSTKTDSAQPVGLSRLDWVLSLLLLVLTMAAYL